MAERGLSGWQIVTLITACIAVIAISAVALIIGKDALIAIAVILVLSVAVGILRSSTSDRALFAPLRRIAVLRK